MLGWEAFVFRQPVDGERVLLASWRTSVFGLKWLDDLASAGKAFDLGGNGYPNIYSVAADVLLPILGKGLPENDSPVVIGEDYMLPARWSSSIKWHGDAMGCARGEQLLVEAWDQS
jgi:hypothetical protein